MLIYIYIYIHTHTHTHKYNNIYIRPYKYICTSIHVYIYIYPKECPGYVTKQSDDEVLAKLELWGKWSIPSLSSLPGPLWPGVVTTDKGPIYALKELNSGWSVMGFFFGISVAYFG